MAFTITADSVPVLDGWGWSEYWSVYDWMRWYKLKKAKYGKPLADLRFKENWDLQSSDANPYNWGKYNADFRAFLKEENLLSAVSNPIADLVTGAGNVVSSAGNVLTGAGETAESAAEGVKSTIKVASFLLPAIFIAVAIIAIITLNKKAKNV